MNVAQGQGYLYQTQGTADLRDDRVIPLGSTSRADRLRVRGASPGDRVCVYDDRHNPPRWGCEDPVSALSSTLKLKEVAGWAPNIVIEPRALPAGSGVVTRTVVNTTQTVTETLPLFQPALAITVTLPQKAPPGQLNIQVLPAYEPGGRKHADEGSLGSRGRARRNESGDLHTGYLPGIADRFGLCSGLDQRHSQESRGS